MPKTQQTVLEAAGIEVTITNPDKVYFPAAGYTKLDLAKYYAAVADGALRGIANRPIVLKRYVNGADAEPFFQKRAPEQHPDWIETVELRVDLDPGPGVTFDDVRFVALVVRDVLDEHALRGWPKTSGSRGIHVNVRIERRWTFDQVRRAALAVAREVERRVPDIATSKWWKEE